MANKQQISAFLVQLGDGSKPLSHRSAQLIDVLAGAQKGNEEYQPFVEEVFKRLQDGTVDEKSKKYCKWMEEVMKQIESAPLRPATFVQLSEVDGGKVPHALVSMDNGALAYVVCRDLAVARKLELGNRVMVDAQSKMLVHQTGNELYFGGEARFERKIDERHIEVVTHQDMKAVVMANQELIKQIEKGEVVPGAQIIINQGENIAIKALPAADGLHYYRYLYRGSIPNVVVDRDIGSPPRVIAQVARHIREEMTRPQLRRKFKLRPCITRLLGGVSGSGKTLSSQAIHRLMYEIMADITKTPMEELPPRVFKMKSSQMLSMWFGESDKQIERMFDEVEKVASEPFKGFTLPVLVMLEEADGLGRARGQDNIYDRIMTVILQRLDPNASGLADKLVVFISTTNEPHLVDPAFLRRIGGEVEIFGRLDQDGFKSILGKHISGLPVDSKENKLVDRISDRLFKEDQGIVELRYAGQQQPETKYRRDFLTGALIDRAVQQSATLAWEESITGNPDAEVSARLLDGAITHQVFSVANQLQPHNVHNYLDLPEGVKVTGIRSLQTEEAAMLL